MQLAADVGREARSLLLTVKSKEAGEEAEPGNSLEDPRQGDVDSAIEVGGRWALGALQAAIAPLRPRDPVEQIRRLAAEYSSTVTTAGADATAADRCADAMRPEGRSGRAPAGGDPS